MPKTAAPLCISAGLADRKLASRALLLLLNVATGAMAGRLPKSNPLFSPGELTSSSSSLIIPFSFRLLERESRAALSLFLFLHRIRKPAIIPKSKRRPMMSPAIPPPLSPLDPSVAFDLLAVKAAFTPDLAALEAARTDEVAGFSVLAAGLVVVEAKARVDVAIVELVGAAVLEVLVTSELVVDEEEDATTAAADVDEVVTTAAATELDV